MPEFMLGEAVEKKPKPDLREELEKMEKLRLMSLTTSVIVLRCSLALVFLAHAIVRVCYRTIGEFSEFLENKGFPHGALWVWAITLFEIIGGVLLAAGYLTKLLSAGFIFLLVMGIILIHAELGWFVGEHGTGGSEYSFILIMSLLVVLSSAGQKNQKPPEKNSSHDEVNKNEFAQ